MHTSIELLKTLKEIPIDDKLVPFRLYYNSCNLELILYGQKTMSKKQKTAKDTTFAPTYDTKEIDLIPLIKLHTLAKEEVELWEHIKNDSNSLQNSSTFVFSVR